MCPASARLGCRRTEVVVRSLLVLALIALAPSALPVSSSPSSVGPVDGACGESTKNGDIDGDSRPDVAIGDPAATVDGIAQAGQVTIAYGEPDSPVPTRTDLLHLGDDIVGHTSHTRDRFGEALDVGYVDGDGCADVLIGVPGKKVGKEHRAGAVVVVFGSVDGLGRGRPSAVWTQRTPGVPGAPERGDRFGSVIALPTDLSSAPQLHSAAIAAPREDVRTADDAGAVFYMEFGSAGRPVEEAARRITQDFPGLDDSAEQGDRFGTSLVLARMAADGSANLFVGTPRESIGGLARAGVVDVISDVGTPATSFGVQWTEDDMQVDDPVEAGDSFGAAISLGVSGYTGNFELTIGAPREDLQQRNAGRVFVVDEIGESFAPDAVFTLDQTDAELLETAERGDRLGATLFAVPILINGGQTHLAIGVPGEDLLGAKNAGLVHDLSIESVDLYRNVTQDTPNVPGTAQAGDRLGSTIGGWPRISDAAPGALLLGAAHDDEYPSGAVIVVPYSVIGGEPGEYVPVVWVPGVGAFPGVAQALAQP